MVASGIDLYFHARPCQQVLPLGRPAQSKSNSRKHVSIRSVANKSAGTATSVRQPASATQATSATAPFQAVARPETAEEVADLRQKCLQAALDIKEHGWTIVEGVLPKGECDAYLDSLWTWLEGLGTGIDRNDPSTFTHDRWPPTYRGILNILEVGHSDFVWRVRKHPRVTKVFELLLGTNELLTSFDAINMLGPHNEAPPPGWLHVDQTPSRQHLACIQGIMNITPVSPDTTGTLLVKDGSHTAHSEFFYEASGLDQETLNAIPDHYPFLPHHLPFFDRFDSIGVKGGPGSLILWDSRCAHSNTGPKQISAWRQVVYVCYQPRDMASERDLQLKRSAFDNYQLTTHLPAQNIRVYDAEFAKTYTNEAKVMDKEIRGNIMRTRHNVEDATLRRLAGVEPYPASEIRRSTPLVDLSVEELQAQLHAAK